jgi:L-fuconolactonase
MRVDAHQHFWKVDRGDYGWMDPAVPTLYRDYLPSDLLPHLAKHKIDRTILVQAAPTTAETDYLLELATQNDFIAGVVGWLDLESPTFSEEFARYRQHPKFVGLRPMIQDLPDDAWITRPAVLRSLKTIAEADFPFDFLTHPRHLPYLQQALREVGPIRGVIDHISKPAIRAKEVSPWRELIAELAEEFPTLYCKLSGMITEANHQNWSAEDLRPYIDHVVDCFGWDRVIFGSDWPVCLLAGDYDQVIRALQTVLAPAMDHEREDKLFGLNAMRFYKLRPE